MTTSTLLAMWLHKAQLFELQLFTPDYGYPGTDLVAAGLHQHWSLQSSLCVKPSLTAPPLFVSLFSSLEISELTNFAELFLILLIMFAQNSHCITQLLENVKLTYTLQMECLCIRFVWKLSISILLKIPCNVCIFN